MHDSNLWFFTLSAIPQTIAAMFALSATFIMFKVSAIKHAIRDDIRVAKWFLLWSDPERNGRRILLMSKDEIARRFHTAVVDFLAAREEGRISAEESEYLRGQFNEIVDVEHRSYGISADMMCVFLLQKAGEFERSVKNGKRMYLYLRMSLASAVAAILFSLIFLPSYYAVTYEYHAVVIILAIAFSVWSVYITSRSIWNIVHF